MIDKLEFKQLTYGEEAEIREKINEIIDYLNDRDKVKFSGEDYRSLIKNGIPLEVIQSFDELFQNPRGLMELDPKAD